MVKFAHMADCHVGSWRDPKLNWVSTQAFANAIDTAVERKVDFILISGDLFNNAVPGIDHIKNVVIKLKELKDKNIPVYLIAGSHDFSPTGKTMLDVLEEAGLAINTAKGHEEKGMLKLDFTIDLKTGTKIVGILGRRNMLEKNYYENLDRESLEQEPHPENTGRKKGIKIFMFHTGINELKPRELKEVECQSLSLFPKNFDYYAGGHVHTVMSREVKGYGIIAYPGPLYPNSFHEIEELGHGGFYIYDNEGEGKPEVEHVNIKIFDTVNYRIICDGKTAPQVSAELLQLGSTEDVRHKIVTLRLTGKISEGRVSDIQIGEAVRKLYDNKAYFVMKNTHKLESMEYEEIKVRHSSIEEMEANAIQEHLGQIRIAGVSTEEESRLVNLLMQALSSEKNEGERQADFEKRIKEAAEKMLELQ